MGIDLSEYIFVGLVSLIDPTHGTAVVTRPDRDGRTTAPLSVLQRGAKDTKDFWMPAIDDQVLCILLPEHLISAAVAMSWPVGYRSLATCMAVSSQEARRRVGRSDDTLRER